MRNIDLTYILAMVFCLIPWQSASPEESGEAWLSTPFYDVVKERNERAIKENTTPFMSELNTCEDQIRATEGKNISDRLTGGEAFEKEIVASVTGLIDYRHKHNTRLESWAADDSSYMAFLTPLRVTAEKIKRIKDENFPKDWRYVAIHWYPYGIETGLQDDSIPFSALDLRPPHWRNGGAPVQEYAFFSFLRKACEAEKFDQDFLDQETGYRDLWDVRPEKMTFHRWGEENFYSYGYIPRKNIPKAEDRPLCISILQRFTPPVQDGNILSAYESKLELFKTIVHEASREESVATNASPYIDIYIFAARSVPFISAFRIGTVPDRTHAAWVNGFPDEHPAASEFNDESPVGLALRMAKRLPNRTVDEVLSPIFLLQSRLDKKQGETASKDFPYKVLRTGFKGYRDYFKHKLRSEVDK